MTATPPDGPDLEKSEVELPPEDPTSLAEAVRNLANRVRDLAAGVRGNRRLSVATAIGLVLDALLTIVTLFVIHAVLHQNDVQNCINDRNSTNTRTSVAFFIAETKKLQGQITGLTDLQHRDNAGFTEFVAATQQALDFDISRLHTLGVKFDSHGKPVIDPQGDPVITNPPPSCG